MYDEDEDQGSVGEFIPGWEDPNRYAKLVDQIACEILGHRVRTVVREHRGQRFQWSYCPRCGHHHSGHAPPFYEVLGDSMKHTYTEEHFRIVGLTDAALLGDL